MNPLDQLASALATTGRIVTAICPEHWAAPTPCAGWDVRTEANHLVGGLRIFAAQLTGDPTDHDHDGTDWLGADPAAAYGVAAAEDLEAWHRPGAMDTVFDLAFGQVPASMALVVHLTEVVVHGLDLAVATGQEHLADQAQAAWLLGLMRQMGTDSFRVPGIFEPERTAGPDAAPHRQLLAFLGRDLTRDLGAVPA
ncbi:TIGR03086 family metal-binding protein [uncultured Nocardioides sp.]|uniref:TIGR03086 family metal-binding protein n=1 Tax=uncultured Nocardioides sp. TaxID=198441 RepID=UPI002628B3AB|nr:TIGR03086 family metal-binding protein [uncultured Nocardioides sp.]